VNTFPIYLFIFIVFLNRYVFGLYLTIVRGRRLDATIAGYEPTITVVIPLYNEGASIYETIVSLVELDYPRDRLEVVVHKGGEQYTSSQNTSRYDSYVGPDGPSGDKPQGLSVEDEVKSGVEN